MGTRKKWDETDGVWDADHGLLDDSQVSRCARANELAGLRSPVPTRIVSNGEYMPPPQTERQKRVEARVGELADRASKELGVDRRRFLASTGGMAAAFLAMNEVFGHFFKVRPTEMFEPLAYAQANTPPDLFVFDSQLHLVRGTAGAAGAGLRALAQGASAPGFESNPNNPGGLVDETGSPWTPWNRALAGLPITPETFQITQFIKDVYLDSQVNVGILTNVTARIVSIGGGPPRPPRNVTEALDGEMLTAAQTAAARNFVNEISGSSRMLAHGLLYVGRGNLDYIQEQIDENEPDAWKGYNISNAAKVDDDPLSPMRQWRHDDEDVAYPAFELIQENYARLRDQKPGFNNIGVHKGLAPGPPDPERGHPGDLPKAARDWPGLNFITYHSCIQPAFFMYDALEEVRSGNMRGGVPDISWTTEYAQLVAPYPNTYAELGTTWASSVITFPTLAAHILGQLLKFMGEDRIVFGSDSVWYGSPQWQIDAMWRFQIPEALQERYGYPELTETAKRKILGLNSARLFGIEGVEGGNLAERFRAVPEDYEDRMGEDLKRILEFPGYTADNMSRFREKYLALGGTPDNRQYGWIRTQA
jgi:predicted TIM-barrel fold metal-dependent hydrolase